MLVSLLSLTLSVVGPASAPVDEPLECELTMSMAPMSEARPAMSTALPMSKSAAELCSEAGDPRCQLQQGDSDAQPQLPRLEARGVGEHERLFTTTADSAGRAPFLLDAPRDSGFLSSVFRPPR